MTKKKYVALARVSSREQEREGFSLEIQEEALDRYVKQHGGTIVKLFRIAETATKPEERRTFREFLAYAKKNARELTGLLFMKVDRAARNLFDYVELERLESECGLEVIYVTQPTENTPAGRMLRRTLANMASFYTEQQSVDVRDGLERRVQTGLFPNKAPYGYRNVRLDGRSVVQIDQEDSPKIRRIHDMYAYEVHTLDSLIDALRAEGIEYTAACPEFTRSKVHAILRDRSYLGEVRFRGQWYPGTHEPIIDRLTWDRNQVLLGEKVYRTHEFTYACELIKCGHCGRPITGERKTKRTEKGPRDYVYYRCADYNADGHPRVRVREEDLDRQVLALFDRIRIKEDKVRDWFLQVLRARVRQGQQVNRDHIADLNRQLTSLRQQQDRLLNLRLLDEINESTFADKGTELRDRIARLSLEVEACDRGRSEQGAAAEKVFELSQTLTEKWVSADVAAKRQLLAIVCLNFSLDGATLSAVMRKPFDVLAEGLSVSYSRGDRRWTFPNDLSGVRLFHAAIAVARPFTAEELEALGRGQAV
jgi:DNA invertase Pin-like site-specific DNA recombinase